MVALKNQIFDERKGAALKLLKQLMWRLMRGECGMRLEIWRQAHGEMKRDHKLEVLMRTNSHSKVVTEMRETAMKEEITSLQMELALARSKQTVEATEESTKIAAEAAEARKENQALVTKLAAAEAWIGALQDGLGSIAISTDFWSGVSSNPGSPALTPRSMPSSPKSVPRIHNMPCSGSLDLTLDTSSVSPDAQRVLRNEVNATTEEESSQNTPPTAEDSTSASRSPGLPRLELGKELQKAKSTRKEERRALEKQALAEVGIEVGTPTDTPRSGAETPRTNASGGRSHR